MDPERWEEYLKANTILPTKIEVLFFSSLMKVHPLIPSYIGNKKHKYFELSLCLFREKMKILFSRTSATVEEQWAPVIGSLLCKIQTGDSTYNFLSDDHNTSSPGISNTRFHEFENEELRSS